MKTIRVHRTKAMVCAVTLLAAVLPAQAGTGDNAALLYYQAFLLYEKPDATTGQMLSDFRAGRIAANEAIREHVEKNRRVIEYVVNAASIPDCNWGYDYSQGIDLTLANLPAVKRVAFLLGTEAQLLAGQGDYRTALDHCMTMHQMALHTVDRTLVPYLMGIAISAYANGTIERVLATMPGDVDALRWLRTQVSQVQDAFPTLESVLVQEGQVCAATMRRDKAQVVLRALELDNPNFATSRAGQRILAGDEAFFERNRTHWFNAIATLASVLRSGQPYPQMYAQFHTLGQKLTDEAKDNPDATFTGISLPATDRIYVLATRLQAHFNAVRTALDLYMLKAQTGRLPETLHAGAPLDPFSGKSFVYEKATNRFTLRCQAEEEPEKGKIDQYEFTIRP